METAQELQESYFAGTGIVVRHFPDSTVPCMKWQCGRNVIELVTLPNGKPVEVERFELLAWASTADGLIDRHNVHGA